MLAKDIYGIGFATNLRRFHAVLLYDCHLIYA
jgi:hypothetical protein